MSDGIAAADNGSCPIRDVMNLVGIKGHILGLELKNNTHTKIISELGYSEASTFPLALSK